MKETTEEIVTVFTDCLICNEIKEIPDFMSVAICEECGSVHFITVAQI